MLRLLLIIASLTTSLVLLVGCQMPPQTRALLDNRPAIKPHYQIQNVPFYPQQQFFCGPTTLAEVANYHQQSLNPFDIAPLTFVPGLEGSLQIEMVAATRQLGMVAYAQQGKLQQLLRLLADDIPVIVLQNNSIAWLPQWHYAVITGYDLDSELLTMHSGVTPNHTLNFSTFERTWQRANYWMLAMLPPEKTSASLEPFLYTKACQDLLDTGQGDVAVVALKSAIVQWPDYWLGYFLLANHYLESEVELALTWYQQGYEYGKHHASFLNNYAYALSAINCNNEAKDIIQQAVMLAPQDLNVLDTQQDILQKSPVLNVQSCQKFMPLK